MQHELHDDATCNILDTAYSRLFWLHPPLGRFTDHSAMLIAAGAHQVVDGPDGLLTILEV
jgi:hypothetical protein